MTLETSTIGRKLSVYSGTYATFPTANATGDLAYSTDRLTLYRWSGSAWAAITIYASSGTAANIPAAANLPNGSLYYETDTAVLKQVQAGAWGAIASSPGGSSGTYAGDGGNDRAIPHGLGVAPTLVIISGGTAGNAKQSGWILPSGACKALDAAQFSAIITPADATNFYTQEQAATCSFNAAGTNYTWMALR